MLYALARVNLMRGYLRTRVVWYELRLIGV